MSEPFIGEIRMFGGNFAPRGWALCDGRLLAIAQNSALFSILGATYGGDGQTTFGLPDLRGRAPLHTDGGQFRQGLSGGAETVTLTAAELPPHNHLLSASSSVGTDDRPAARALSASGPWHVGAGNTTLAAGAMQSAGGGVPHDNMQPWLAILFIIALEGIYPSRS